MNGKSYIINAFVNDRFSGNPAGVCILGQWPADADLLSIAKSNGMPETAMLIPDGINWQIRWFTPVCEVDLCGHATLAAGFVLFNEVGVDREYIKLLSGVGELTVSREDGYLVLDFPARPGKPAKAPQKLIDSISIKPDDVYIGVDIMAVLGSQKDLIAVEPDLDLIRKFDGRGLIVTAPGEDVDFVSRFFAPKIGIDEDHVTGSAHCQLTPYWAEKLGKAKLLAHQLSSRGGELVCELKGERVLIAGKCRKE